MSNILKEILDMVAMPYKWIDNNRATFEFEGKKYGICVEPQRLKLDCSGKTCSIANISFGVIKNKIFHSANDLDTRLTNSGKPRTIMSTVAEACLANSSLKQYDMICLSAADQAREKRALLYSLATSELLAKDKSLKYDYDFKVKTKTGVLINILSRVSFTDEEQSEIAKDLGIDKL